MGHYQPQASPRGTGSQPAAWPCSCCAARGWSLQAGRRAAMGLGRCKACCCGRTMGQQVAGRLVQAGVHKGEGTAGGHRPPPTAAAAVQRAASAPCGRSPCSGAATHCTVRPRACCRWLQQWLGWRKDAGSAQCARCASMRSLQRCMSCRAMRRGQLPPREPHLPAAATRRRALVNWVDRATMVLLRRDRRRAVRAGRVQMVPAASAARPRGIMDDL